MTCAEFRYLIDDYFERSLTGKDKDDFNNHLISCYNCQVEFDKYKQLFKDIDQLPSNYEAPDGLYEHIAQVIGKRITETSNTPIFPTKSTGASPELQPQTKEKKTNPKSKSKEDIIPETKTTSKLMQNLLIIVILAMLVLLLFLSYKILKG